MDETRTFTAMIEGTAAWHPDADAVVQGDAPGRRLTYTDLTHESRAFANALAARGVGKGDRVGLLARTTVEHAVAFVAVTKLGAIPANLHWRDARDSISGMIADIDPTALVVQPGIRDDLDGIAAGTDAPDLTVALDHHADTPPWAESATAITADADTTAPAVDLDPGDVGFINFTSGSTGRPKPIVHTHHDMVEAAHLGTYRYRVHDDDVLLTAATPSFVAWTLSLLPYTAAGATVVFLERWDPEVALRVVEDETATVLRIPPTLWRGVLDADPDAYDLSSLRMVGYAAEPMSPETFRAVREHVCEDVFTVFGTTETMTSGLVLFPEHVTEETLESVGKPAPTVEVRIVDPESRDPADTVDRGAVGELFIRGPSVAEEVWGDPEATRETFHPDGWFMSGDLAAVGPGGNVYIRGRADNMIISGGINVYPAEVENVLERHDAVVEAAVIGVPHDEWGEAVCAYVIAPDATADDLDAFCRGRDDLADHKRPREYAFVDDLPRTASDKLDRRRLRESHAPDRE